MACQPSRFLIASTCKTIHGSMPASTTALPYLKETAEELVAGMRPAWLRVTHLLLWRTSTGTKFQTPNAQRRRLNRGTQNLLNQRAGLGLLKTLVDPLSEFYIDAVMTWRKRWRPRICRSLRALYLVQNILMKLKEDGNEKLSKGFCSRQARVCASI
jgi:hypothetical protein